MYNFRRKVKGKDTKKTGMDDGTNWLKKLNHSPLSSIVHLCMRVKEETKLELCREMRIWRRCWWWRLRPADDVHDDDD